MADYLKWIPFGQLIDKDGTYKACPLCGGAVEWPHEYEHIWGMVCRDCYAVFSVKRKFFRKGFAVFTDEEVIASEKIY